MEQLRKKALSLGASDLRKSKKKGKKYDVIYKGKVISFGSEGMSDFTIHKDKERKQRYLDRHKKNENWNDPMTAGALSRWILWNKPTLDASIKDFKKRFKLK